MTREEVMRLVPGDLVLIADGPFKGGVKAMPDQEYVWGTVATVERIHNGDDYPVEVEECESTFHCEEIVCVMNLETEQLPEETMNVNAKVLFDMLGIVEC